MAQTRRCVFSEARIASSFALSRAPLGAAGDANIVATTWCWMSEWTRSKANRVPVYNLRICCAPRLPRRLSLSTPWRNCVARVAERYAQSRRVLIDAALRCVPLVKAGVEVGKGRRAYLPQDSARWRRRRARAHHDPQKPTSRQRATESLLTTSPRMRDHPTVMRHFVSQTPSNALTSCNSSGLSRGDVSPRGLGGNGVR